MILVGFEEGLSIEIVVGKRDGADEGRGDG
jgi:hypothetical protein